MVDLTNLSQFLKSSNVTLLGLGSVSLNSVKTIIDFANKYEVPSQLICSRRQIDSRAMGGGYVGGLSTEDFVEFVRRRDRKNLICISRDHGGPWQNEKEVRDKLPLAEAMKSAKASFAQDIESGMDAIHIDPSFDPGGVSKEEVIDRIVELYHFCIESAQKASKKPLFEIGSEQQAESFENYREFNEFLSSLLSKLKSNHLPLPHFVVLQTGTKVVGKSNSGDLPRLISSFGSLDGHSAIEDLRLCVRKCNEAGLMIKSHNGDYLSNEALNFFPLAGIHAINIAPELASYETSFILNSLLALNLREEHKSLIHNIVQEQKWLKWIDPETESSEELKAEISGHYSYEKNFFKKTKSILEENFAQQGRNLDGEIMLRLSARIEALHKNLNWKI